MVTIPISPYAPKWRLYRAPVNYCRKATTTELGGNKWLASRTLSENLGMLVQAADFCVPVRFYTNNLFPNTQKEFATWMLLQEPRLILHCLCKPLSTNCRRLMIMENPSSGEDQLQVPRTNIFLLYQFGKFHLAAFPSYAWKDLLMFTLAFK